MWQRTNTTKLLGCLILIVGIGMLNLRAYSSDSVHSAHTDLDIEITNGESIYMNGKNLKGKAIPFTHGPEWMKRDGGGCVSCHGDSGKGGGIPPQCSITAPAIHWTALTGANHHHETKDNDKHHHVSYTQQTLHKALVQGITPSGEKLNKCMPRWKLSESEFNDLLKYIMKLGSSY